MTKGTFYPDGLIAVIKDKKGNKYKDYFDNILICLGREANTCGLHLDKAGVVIDDKGYIVVDSRMRTNKPDIYAIGDVIGGAQLAHVASKEGEIAVQNALGYEALADYKAIPNCVFTNPEIGSAGLTEAEAIAAGYQIKVGRFPFNSNGKALADNEVLGLVKFVADAKDDRILGIHILGPQASVLICEGVLAIEMGSSLSDITKTIHAHPTLGEAIVEAALQANGKALHLTRGVFMSMLQK